MRIFFRLRSRHPDSRLAEARLGFLYADDLGIGRKRVALLSGDRVFGFTFFSCRIGTRGGALFARGRARGGGLVAGDCIRIGGFERGLGVGIGCNPGGLGSA